MMLKLAALLETGKGLLGQNEGLKKTFSFKKRMYVRVAQKQFIFFSVSHLNLCYL